MTEKTAGIRLRTALFRWIMASILTWIALNGLIAALQTAITGVKHGFGSEEIATPFEALMFRLVRIMIVDAKYILATVLLWGLFYYFVKSINETWKNMILSLTIVFIAVTGISFYVSSSMIDKAVIIDTGAFIYLSLLAPRLIFSNLRPRNIL